MASSMYQVACSIEVGGKNTIYEGCVRYGTYRGALPVYTVGITGTGRLGKFGTTSIPLPAVTVQTFVQVPNTSLRSDIFFFFSLALYFPASGQAVVTGVVPSPPRFLLSVFIAHRVQQSHCSSTFHRVLLTHALALSASQFVHKKKSQRIYAHIHLISSSPLTHPVPSRIFDILLLCESHSLLLCHTCTYL